MNYSEMINKITQTELNELDALLLDNDLNLLTSFVLMLDGEGEQPVIKLLSVAQCLSDRGLVDQTASLYKIWLKHSRSDVDYAVLFNLGVVLFNKEDYIGAEQCYRNAIALKVDFFESYFSLGVLLEKQNKPALALNVLYQAVDLMRGYLPKNEELYSRINSYITKLLEEMESLLIPLVKDLVVDQKIELFEMDEFGLKQESQEISSKQYNQLPLVSILIPTHNRPEYFEVALESALSQTYENIEIIISDNSDNSLSKERVASLLMQHANVIYSYNKGISLVDNFKNCLKLANGEYINYLMDDDIFHPDKIKRMMYYYISYPDIGLVTSFRQVIDENGKYLPSFEKLFQIDTMIDGVSLGHYMINQCVNLIGEPTTVLLRRSDINNSFGILYGRQYRGFADFATWLSILSVKNCIYISDTLSFFRMHSGQDQRQFETQITMQMEWIRMLLGVYENGHFIKNEGEFNKLLSKKIQLFSSEITTRYEEIKNWRGDINEISSLIRAGYEKLLSSPV